MRARRTACHALFLAAVVAACLTAMTHAEARSSTPGYGDRPTASVIQDARRGDSRKVRLKGARGAILHLSGGT